MDDIRIVEAVVSVESYDRWAAGKKCIYFNWAVFSKMRDDETGAVILDVVKVDDGIRLTIAVRRRRDST